MNKDWVVAKLKYPNACSVCGGGLRRGGRAMWNAKTSEVKCYSHYLEENLEIEKIGTSNTAGSSALEYYDQGLARELEKEVRRKSSFWLIADWRETGYFPSKTLLKWHKGAKGELKTSEALAEFGRKWGAKVLHDLKLSGAKGNIDHVMFLGSQIYVIDSKNLKGNVTLNSTGNSFPLRIDNYSGKSLVDGVLKQSAVLAKQLGKLAKMTEFKPVLLFVGSGSTKETAEMEVNGVQIWRLESLTKLEVTSNPREIHQQERNYQIFSEMFPATVSYELKRPEPPRTGVGFIDKYLGIPGVNNPFFRIVSLLTFGISLYAIFVKRESFGLMLLTFVWLILISLLHLQAFLINRYMEARSPLKLAFITAFPVAISSGILFLIGF